MDNEIIFLFDLDSTVTKEEILPTISKKINRYDEMRDLTEKTMMGDLLFEESFVKRVEILKDIPVSEVAEIVSNIKINKEVAKFLKENRENCYIVTSNLNVWIEKLMEKLGMKDHYFCSKAKVVQDKIIQIDSILSKSDMVKKFEKSFVVAVGDGSNDRMMLQSANIGIGFGGVRDISPELMDVIDYAIYDEKKLYSFLNQIQGKEGNSKTIVISCAGMGKRLGRQMPKAVVEVNGKSLVKRNISQINNEADIRVVVGYKFMDVINEVNSFRRNVLFVFNRNYMNNGTGASLSIASKYSNHQILAIDGDLIIHPNDMQAVLNETDEFVGVSKKSTDDPVLVTVDKNNYVVKFSREEGDYEWNGICLINKENFKEGDKHVYQLLEPIIPKKIKIFRTKEIDTPNDFAHAEKWVKNNFVDTFTIGILGGMGTYATIDLYTRLVNSFTASKEWDRPRIIIDNRCTLPSRIKAILYEERKEELIESLCESISIFINNNVDYIIIDSYITYAFINDICEKIPLSRDKILNLMEICVNQIEEEKVKIYVSEKEISSNIYNIYFDKEKIQISFPNENETRLIKTWTEAVKTNNISKKILDSFIEYVNKEKVPIILGCTELPILYNQCKNEINTKIIDPIDNIIEYLKKVEKK